MAVQQSMRDRIVLITGGTGGIGKETALGLAALGAHVVVVGRNRQRGEAAVQDIVSRTGNPGVEILLADLTSQAQVRQLAADFRARHDRLHVLVNNVGGANPQRLETPDGLEATFAAGHLAPFLLTNLLLDIIIASAPARIVNVTSTAHRFANLDLDDLQLTHGFKPMKAYRKSKLANVLFSYELARRLEGTGVTVNLADPGVADTEGSRSAAAPWFRKPQMALMKRSMSAAKGAKSSIYLASSPEVQGLTGRYFNPRCEETKSGKASYDQDLARRIWEISEQLTGITSSIPSPSSR